MFVLRIMIYFSLTFSSICSLKPKLINMIFFQQEKQELQKLRKSILLISVIILNNNNLFINGTFENEPHVAIFR